VELINALAEPACRSEAAAALARYWDVDAILVLVKDDETGALFPAPGFPQTLPGGPTWRSFFRRCETASEIEGEIAFPDATTFTSYKAYAGQDGSVLVLLGGKPQQLTPADLAEIGFPLVSALLRTESKVVASSGLATESSKAMTRATALASALEGARSEVALKAAALERSLKDAAHLNKELRDLNATLERRVEAEVAQRLTAEESLRQAQKMEAVGQLTGGIAHDFNNLLAGIVGSLDLMQTRMSQGRTESIERYAKAAMSSAQRAAALTHRLLAFSRRQPLDPKPVGANGLVTGMEDLLRRTIGPLHALELVTAGGLWTTLCDPNQLESAILNLAINARDAMPDGGKLTIETCNAYLDDAYVAAQRDVTPGQYICICITDTGVGMPPDVIARAFEPFFTTKPLGQGTGLGLSMVYGFAKQSEGHLKIYSEEGKGTTVKIYLPRHRGAAEEDDVASPAAEPQRAEAGETVLVVEDEPVIRDLIVEVLQDLGYRALEAADGPSGLKILQSRKRIDLLVTDVGLPGLNGRQLADQARVKRPDLKVLFITGYAENATLANGFLDPGMEMITKPFAVEALATKIRSMIRDR
jgi:signal transduction histidine kinase